MQPDLNRLLVLVGLVAGAGIASAQKQMPSADILSPSIVECPKGLHVRPAKEGLSRYERAWKSIRAQSVIPALDDYLTLVGIEGFNVTDYVRMLGPMTYPVVGLSVSGGGTQSGVGGLGIWQAFDIRNPAAIYSRTGGLSQILTYLTGLSGGGALTVSALASNDYMTTYNIRRSVNFSVDYTRGPDDNQDQYLGGIFDAVATKAKRGFPVSAADAFGLFWATYLPQDRRYDNFSDLATQDTYFSRGEAPMPIITLAEVVPGQSPAINEIMWPGRNATNGFNLTSYEVTPFEFGSWQGGRVQAFMPTMFLGSAMSNGSVVNSSSCVRGFDKWSFIQGSTTSAFNAWFIDDWFGVPVFAKRGAEAREIPVPAKGQRDGRVLLVSEVAEEFNRTFNESLWATYPNPFKNFNPAMKNVDELLLVDGSLTGETNPIRPLIVPEREVDFIIVYEASSDAQYSWVNGTNLINTAQSAEQGGIPFPRIPDVTTFITRNLTRQPTFFGCYDPNPNMPLVLYLPNSPWSGYSNFSYAKSSFTENEFDLTADNAFQLATYGNGTVDKEWPACLACAVIGRSLARLARDWPDQCRRCFERHCWDGQLSTRAVRPQDLDPRLRMNASMSFQEWNRTYWSSKTRMGGASTGGDDLLDEGPPKPKPAPGNGLGPSGAGGLADLSRGAVVVTVASVVGLVALL
ncbi:Lysophospholipase 1 [Colletotrichum orbiculare MAFF 240422]|uniref:Lysophospholipase n=1 Tax=Colletotrichum orbiculare (strain 104-T / ATCC 96160 / CBS 514.97 / LARS 414 / MAFF 240422) TaxID=1213857 RepID=N4VAF0_COLOR|nr:Lysophospholipase 1 [Colletotrichum orbiculare MAFF 240422]